MDRNQIIGFILILLVMLGWSELFVKPRMEKEALIKKVEDSLKQASTNEIIPPSTFDSSSAPIPTASSDTVLPINSIEDKTFLLKNSLAEYTISNKGGFVQSAKLYHYKKLTTDSAHQTTSTELELLNDAKNKFNFKFQTSNGELNSSKLIFQPVEVSESKLIIKASNSTGGFLTYEYKLDPQNYKLDFTVTSQGLGIQNEVNLYWEDYLDKLEKNSGYERSYSSLYFKEQEENADYCSCTHDDVVDQKKKIQWFANANQFFCSAIIPSIPFSSGKFETVMQAENAEDLKSLKSSVSLPAELFQDRSFNFQLYIGPNEYERLKSFNNHLEDVISYGWSIFGTINKYLIRPLFSFLNDFIGSKGIIIILMTLIVKLLVFPLSYKMLQSQAKMLALKPEIDKVKARHKEDLQQQQVETMKMYNEFGVNPLGGCFPLLLQTPIWIALYRFFPATINFRQESFLWAADLTSYDEFIFLPFSIPFFGNTLSLFAFLWVVSTVIFTYYNSKTTDFSANPAMLYMQYLMPLFFWFMFNKTAAGLTCYMFFSNLLNIGQTIMGRSILFNTEKIRASLELNKLKPKKKGGFQSKLEEMMKERQRLEQERIKNSKKK